MLCRAQHNKGSKQSSPQSLALCNAQLCSSFQPAPVLCRAWQGMAAGAAANFCCQAFQRTHTFL